LFGCQDQQVSVVDEEIQDEELTFAKIPLLSDKDAAKQISDNQSDYYCLVSTLHDNEKINPYRYSAVWLHFPKGILDKVEKKSTEDMWLSVVLGDSKASEKKGVSKFSEDGVVRMARCFLPDLPEAREMIQDKIIEFSPDSWVGSSQKTTGKQPTQSNSSFCEERFVTEVCRSTAGIVYDCQITEDRCVEYDFGGSGTWPEFDGDEEEGNSGGGGSTIPEDPEEGCQDYGDPCYTEDGLPVSCPGEDEDEDHGQDDMFQTLSKDLEIYNSSGNMTLDSTCSDEEEEEDEFFENIIIDPSVINNPKVKCVLDGLLNDGNTLSDTIVKFAGDSVDIDLKIEVGEVDNDDPGILISSSLSNIFTLRIDNSRAQERLPIQIATTFMHEAIHAEMRRFLYGAKGSSTLPGFPGSFAEDWVLYVNKQNGKDFNDQVSIAEHNAMALKYVGLIIEGLEGFDNNNLTYDQYYALALEGLFYTDVFTELNRSYSERQEYDQNFESALQSSSTSCLN
jgi:hypothetical protein